MLIRDKRHFNTGVVMAIAFFGLFGLIMSPIFGKGMNGLEFSDDMFNKLSKGSAYFVPKVSKQNESYVGKQIQATVKYDKPDDAKKAAELVAIAGGKSELNGGELKVSGDVGKMLEVVIRDGDLMYKNDGAKLKETYGYDEKQAMKNWWTLLTKIDKALQLSKDFENAKMINEVNKKVVEPAYNFYGIQAQKVTDRLGMMSALLVFYVGYTIWWGYALFHLFEGLGLTVHKKVKVKKEI
ncbi:MAG: hypothetical protein GX423_04245 [Nitrospiraceae bacterium]|jgi:hypothetical protein|nr:hypothetical protein [Nitrospiraceae bacterium]